MCTLREIAANVNLCQVLKNLRNEDVEEISFPFYCIHVPGTWHL